MTYIYLELCYHVLTESLVCTVMPIQPTSTFI